MMLLEINGLEWIVVGVIPALTLLFREIAVRRTHKHTEKVSATDAWLGQFNAIRNEWDSLREDLARRVQRAEDAELECEKRCAELEIRVVQIEADRAADRAVIHQQREQLTVLQLELDVLNKKVIP